MQFMHTKINLSGCCNVKIKLGNQKAPILYKWPVLCSASGGTDSKGPSQLSDTRVIGDVINTRLSWCFHCLFHLSICSAAWHCALRVSWRPVWAFQHQIIWGSVGCEGVSHQPYPVSLGSIHSLFVLSCCLLALSPSDRPNHWLISSAGWMPSDLNFGSRMCVRNR